MEWDAILAAISGNIVALICLIAWQSERKERIKLSTDYSRFMMAVARYKTDPDDSNVVRIEETNQDPYDTKIVSPTVKK